MKKFYIITLLIWVISAFVITNVLASNNRNIKKQCKISKSVSYLGLLNTEYSEYKYNEDYIIKFSKSSKNKLAENVYHWLLWSDYPGIDPQIQVFSSDNQYILTHKCKKNNMKSCLNTLPNLNVKLYNDNNKVSTFFNNNIYVKFIYNAQNKLLSSYKTDNNYTKNIRYINNTQNTYNSLGLLEKKDTISKDYTSQKEENCRTSYTYNSNKKLLSEYTKCINIDKHFYSGNGTFTSWKKYIYDKNGNIIQENYSAGKTTYSYKYKYDEHNNKIATYYCKNNDKSCEQRSKMIYECK